MCCVFCLDCKKSVNNLPYGRRRKVKILTHNCLLVWRWRAGWESGASDVLMAFSSYVQLMMDSWQLSAFARLLTVFLFPALASVYRTVARGIFILEGFHTRLTFWIVLNTQLCTSNLILKYIKKTYLQIIWYLWNKKSLKCT